MQLTRCTPFFPSTDHLFPSFFDRLFSNDHQQLPALNVHEHDQSYEVKVAAPGLKKDQFSISEEAGLLRISCTVEDKKKETDSDQQLIHEEFNYLNWSRKIQLPKAQIDTSKIKASYKEGVLRVDIPKRKEAIRSSQNIAIE